MKKSLLEIYALAVCFVTMVCFVIASGIAAYALVGVANPEFTMSSWEYERHQTNERYWKTCRDDPGCERPPSKPDVHADQDTPPPPGPHLAKLREASFQIALNAEGRSNLQTVVKSLIVVLIDLAVFMLHWGVARRARAG